MNQKTSEEYLIKNASVWSSQSEPVLKDILVKNGTLIAIQSHIEFQGERIEANGKALLPSGVDAQVHLRVPGQEHKETANTGLLAALKGGYAAILTMPNTQPTIDNPEILLKAKAEVEAAEKKFGVSVFWSAAITKNLNSNDLTNFQKLIEAGAVAFTNDGLGVESDAVMRQAFSLLNQLPVPLLQHAEFLGHGGTLAPGPIQQKLNAIPYPDEAEWKMVERDLRLLKEHPKARYHVLHVSSRHSIELVREAKKQGLKVTAEASPHHLYFNTKTISADDLSFKMNPPIRSEEDQQALWSALADGTIDFVATDHAPHESGKKTGAIADAAFGTLGLETTLRVLLQAWKQQKLTSQRLVEVFSLKPAKFLGLTKEFGEFSIGSRFHGTLIDIDAKDSVFTKNDISSLSKNSCFVGQSLPGHITAAFHGTQLFDF